ncbi:MAG: hypothetical protein IPH35_13500 [Rhodoferax sp.]|nr:hypothetical protein [Rhodoferax sp.]
MTTDPLEAFRTAIAASGMQPPEAIIPGVLQRFSPTGKHGDLAGWYVFFDDGIPSGAYGNWRDSSQMSWCSKSDNDMTDTERDAHRQRMEAARKQRDADKAQQQEATAQAAKTRWDAAQPATGHPYTLPPRESSPTGHESTEMFCLSPCMTCMANCGTCSRYTPMEPSVL